ncbi:MAG: hypothetical protein IKE70_03450 [Bacilli bacterium]|nr:hypothetical protein [Bacilli bacterium]
MKEIGGINLSEEDKKIIGNKKHLYDETILYDESNLPNELKNYIKELKKFDKVKDWLNYDLKFDEFEVRIRCYLRANRITLNDYKKLIAKYGWLYD